MCLYVVGWDILVCSVNRAMEEGVARWRQQSGHAGSHRVLCSELEASEQKD